MEASGAGSNTFSLVRQGYDTDEVEAFLHSQAVAWQTALRQAEQRAVDLEHELEKAQRREAALLNGLNSATHARESNRAEVDSELVAKRAEHEKALQKLTEETEASVAQQLSEAETQAANLIQQAEQQVAASEAELETTRASRLAALESEHLRKTSSYQQAEAKLVDTIKDLNSMRVALIDGLQAIAEGGLTNAKAIDDLLDEIGIDADNAMSNLLVSEIDEPSSDS